MENKHMKTMNKRIFILIIAFISIRAFSQITPVSNDTLLWEQHTAVINANDSILEERLDDTTLFDTVSFDIVLFDTTDADGVLLQFNDTVNGSTGRNTFYNKTQVDVLVAAGGGGGNDSTAIQVLEFTTADANSPSAGDTILIQNGFIGKNLEVFAEGKRLNRTDRNSKGFYHTSTSDTMYIHPPFKDDSVYAVKIYSTYGYEYIALEGGGAAAYTDDFNSYTSGLLSGNPNWNHVIGAMTANGSGGIYPNAAGNNAASYNGAVTANHYSQLSTAGNSTRWIGPATRITGTDGTASYYAYQNDGNNVRFIKVTNGTETVIATHTIVGAANTLRLESNGTTHSCYLNGALDTGLTGGTGVFVDSDHSSGDVGVSGYNGSSIKVGDNWSGGDL